MKKVSLFAAVAGAMVLLNSCGASHALISNSNLNTTQVQLAGNNFKVVDKVSGTSDVSYILGIGGLNKKQLFENAYSAMMDKANLKGGARAVVNNVTEEHIGGLFPIYFKRTVTVSCNVVEFTK